MHQDVLAFWFDEIEEAQWWRKDDTFDALIGTRFGELHASASVSELSDWRDTAEGRLAEVIVLDQFSRNIFRNTPRAFSQDPLALALAQEAVRSGADQQLTVRQRNFLYMPYMHSESAKVHEEAVRLFEDLGDERCLDYELRHKAIIDRFGRYPHRNEILDRASTAEEVEFLKQPGSSF